MGNSSGKRSGKLPADSGKASHSSNSNKSPSRSPSPSNVESGQTATATISDSTEAANQKEEALRKIQRLVRKKSAMQLTKAELHWKIFSDLDTIEETEMHHLATFMNVLLEKVPDRVYVTRDWEASTPKTEDGDTVRAPRVDEESIMLGDIGMIDIGTSVQHANNHADYNVPSGADINGNVLNEIIDAYKHGRKVCPDLVYRLAEDCAALIREFPNIRRLEVPSGGKLTVVGDLHGSLSDILHILGENGPPSESNLYVFNGDFVDRGSCGVEVMVVLMACFRAQPDYVVLNRGNHEDRNLTSTYGFEQECLSKYSISVYDSICLLFDTLTLFVLVNESIFIVHGGLFIDRTVKFADLEKIDRFNYEFHAAVPYPECLEGLNEEDQWSAFTKELQRDAIWSDPRMEPGLAFSPRGSGVMFGPDIAAEFMANNDVKMVIRSHELCQRGFGLPFANNSPNPAFYNPSLPLLCTIFSASNYCQGDNEAAVLTIMTHEHLFSNKIPNSSLFYSIHRFKTSSADTTLESSNQASLAELIVKKKSALRNDFEAIDTENTGVVSRLQWAEVMRKVTTMRIRWLAIIDSIVPAECLSGSKSIDYRKFLAEYSTSLGAAASSSPVHNQVVLDSLYGHRKKMELIFRYFDADCNGVITKDEFYAGCALLNAHLSETEQLTDIEHTLQVIDFDGSGQIDLNEFFEAFRIAGNVDQK